MSDEQPKRENPPAGTPGYVPPSGWNGCLCRVCRPYDYPNPKYDGIHTHGDGR